MLHFKTNDEMLQVKRFVAVYYEPITTHLERSRLKQEVPMFRPMTTC